MSIFQYGFLAYALYLIYSGISNKQKLKQPNPVFPDEEVNVLFVKIDKTLKLCSTICIFLGFLIIFTIFIDLIFNFAQITNNCIKCNKSGDFLFWLAFVIFCLSIFLILLNGSQFWVAGNLSGLKDSITTYYQKQQFNKKDDWESNKNIDSSLFNDADAMKYNMKQCMHCYFGMKFGLYLYYISLFIFILSFVFNSKYIQ